MVWIAKMLDCLDDHLTRGAVGSAPGFAKSSFHVALDHPLECSCFSEYHRGTITDHSERGDALGIINRHPRRRTDAKTAMVEP